VVLFIIFVFNLYIYLLEFFLIVRLSVLYICFFSFVSPETGRMCDVPTATSLSFWVCFTVGGIRQIRFFSGRPSVPSLKRFFAHLLWRCKADFDHRREFCGETVLYATIACMDNLSHSAELDGWFRENRLTIEKTWPAANLMENVLHKLKRYLQTDVYPFNPPCHDNQSRISKIYYEILNNPLCHADIEELTI
jgi:hypothetical protein